MTKRGRSPSLISGKTPKIQVAIRTRTCKRCHGQISSGEECVIVPIPARMGSKTYCTACFLEILSKTRKDLDTLDALFTSRERN